MSADLAALGLKLETKPLEEGIKVLDKAGIAAEKAAGKFDKASGNTDKLSESTKKVTKSTDSAAVSMQKFLAQIGAGTAMVAFIKQTVDAEVRMQKLANTLKFSTGSMESAAREMEYLKSTTQRLGLEFTSSADAYAKFSAAAKGTSIEGQKARDVFEAVSKASVVMGLSADEASGALLAISQMVSKGTVAAEELRGQLGERLPGAFQIAARAMGVTTAELGKMLQQGEVVADDFLPKFAKELNKTLGDNAESAAGSAQAQLNKLTNAWSEFKIATAQSGVMTIVLKVAEGSTDALKWFNHFVFNKGDLADAQRKNGVLENLNILRDRQKSLASSWFASDEEKKNIAQQIRNLEVQLNPNLRNPNAVPGMSAIGGGVFSPDFSPNFDSGKDSGGGWGNKPTNKATTHNYLADLVNDARDTELERIRENALEEQKQFEKNAEEKKKLMQQAASDQYADLVKLGEFDRENQIKSYEQEKDLTAKLQKQDEDAAEAKMVLIKKEADARQKLAEETTRWLTDALMRGFENGEGFVKNFRNTLSNAINTLILRPVISFIVNPIGQAISASIGGLFASGSASASTGASGSAGGALSGVSSLWSAFSGSTSGAVTSFATSGIGQMLGLSNTFTNVAGEVITSLSSVGSALATAAPYVAAAMAVFSLVGGGMFAAHVMRPKGYANTSVSSAGVSTLSSWTNGEGDVSAQAIGAGSSLGKYIMDVAKLFGGSIKEAFTIGTKYMQKYNSLGVTVGHGITKTNSDFTIDLNNKDSVTNGFARTFLDAVKMGYVKLDAYLNNFIGALKNGAVGNSGKQKNFLDQALELKALYDSFANLPPIFGKVKTAIDGMFSQDTLIRAQKMAEATKNFYNLFYSDEEKFSDLSKTLHKQLTALNVSFPDTRDGFKQLVQGIDTSTAAGTNLYESLVNLAGSMDEYFKAIDAEAANVANLAKTKRALEIQLMTSEDALAATRADELAAMDASLRPLLEQIYARQDLAKAEADAKAATDALIGSMTLLGKETFATKLDYERYQGRATSAGIIERKSTFTGDGSSVAELKAEISAMRADNNANAIANAKASQTMAKIIQRWEGDGMPAVRSV